MFKNIKSQFLLSVSIIIQFINYILRFLYVIILSIYIKLIPSCTQNILVVESFFMFPQMQPYLRSPVKSGAQSVEFSFMETLKGSCSGSCTHDSQGWRFQSCPVFSPFLTVLLIK